MVIEGINWRALYLLFNRGVDVKFLSVRSLLNIDTLFFTSDKYIVRVVSSYVTPVRATASPTLAWPMGVLLRAKKSISLPITTAKSAKRRILNLEYDSKENELVFAEVE